MEKTAPYASQVTLLSLTSAVGMRYRTVHCLECGMPILERNKDSIFRVGTKAYPGEAKPGGMIDTVCDRCTQNYKISIAISVRHAVGGLPLHLQPQSVFLKVEPEKSFRDTFCLECGKAYFSISDRISMVVDNVTPQQLWNPERMGPMEARCKFQHCKQRFYMRV